MSKSVAKAAPSLHFIVTIVKHEIRHVKSPIAPVTVALDTFAYGKIRIPDLASAK